MNTRTNYMHFQPNRNDTYISQDWNSLFISVLPKEYCTESALVNLLENDLGIGYVEKVNIVNKKNPGKAPHAIAFVHFHYWFRTEDTDFVRNSIDSAGKCDIYGYFDQNNVGYSFQDSNGKPLYLRFAKLIPTNTPMEKPVETLTMEKQSAERIELNAQALRIAALESQMQQIVSILFQPAPKYTKPIETPSFPNYTKQETLYFPKYNEDDCILPLRLEELFEDYPKKLSILNPEYI